MKRITIFLLLSLISFAGGGGIAQTALQQQAVHLATALDHITVLEFGEPVTLAAAGSSAFNIEWRANKVLIKPLKQGAATDLFVWTASQRFAYELDPPGEAKNMNFAVDNPVPVSKPVINQDADARMAEIADMVLTRAFLGADNIENGRIRNRKGDVVVRIENVFQSANSVYVRYSIQNLTGKPYRVVKPSVFQIAPAATKISLTSMERTQLDTGTIRALRETKRNSLTVVRSEISNKDIASGEVTRGVVVLRQQFSAPTVLELAFGDAGDRHVSATFVF